MVSATYHLPNQKILNSHLRNSFDSTERDHSIIIESVAKLGCCKLTKNELQNKIMFILVEKNKLNRLYKNSSQLEAASEKLTTLILACKAVKMMVKNQKENRSFTSPTHVNKHKGEVSNDNKSNCFQGRVFNESLHVFKQKIKKMNVHNQH